MKHPTVSVAIGLLLMLVCYTPAVAQNLATAPYVAQADSQQKTDDAQEKERKQKQQKEEEARLEAEKRARVEEQKRHEAEDAARAKDEERRKDEDRKAQDQREEARKQEEQKQQEQRKEQARKQEEQQKLDQQKQQERQKEEEARLEVEKRKQVDEQKRREAEEAARTNERNAREEERRKERDRHDLNQSEEARHQDAPPVQIVLPMQQTTSETGQATSPNVVVPPTQHGSSDADLKQKEAQLEIEKRRQLEREQQREHHRRYYETDYAYVPSPAPVPAPRNPDYVGSYYHEPEPRAFYVGVVCAPGNGDRRTAVGLQYLTNRNYGVGVWFAGKFQGGDDVIQATIPHDDFHTESSKGTYGLQALYAFGSETAMLIIGAGVSVDQETFVDVSNATGWKWDGGTSTTTKPAAQIGARFLVGGRVSLQVGYDTSQSAFFGLSASF